MGLAESLLLKPLWPGAKLFGDPIGDVVDNESVVVGATMLGAAIGETEDLQFAIAAVDRMLVGLFRVPQRDLPVVFAVDDQERAGDLIGELAKVHLPHDRPRLIQGRGAEHPLRMVDKTGHRRFLGPADAGFERQAEIEDRAPGDAALEPLLERGRARGVVAA